MPRVFVGIGSNVDRDASIRAGVADLRADAAAQMAEQHKIEAFSTADELLEKSDLELISIWSGSSRRRHRLQCRSIGARTARDPTAAP